MSPFTISKQNTKMFASQDALSIPTLKDDVWGQLKISGNSNFESWFKNSKVVDDRGDPLVVFHGSDCKIDVFNTAEVCEIDRRRAGAYFSSIEKYARLYGEHVTPVFLSLQNPLDISSLSPWEAIDCLPLPEMFKKELRSAFKTPGVPQYGLIESAVRAGLQTLLQSEGYDGIIYKEAEQKAFIAFHPEQIKSATANSGEFNPKSSNINL